MAVWNGAVWAVGNGLAGTTLIIYLANELHAKQRFGLSIGLILAAPHIVGLLRIGAPAMIGRFADRKRFCIGVYLSAGLLLMALPWICSPGMLPAPGWSLAALVMLWCLYHLLQYLGTVALWSWLADACPMRIRGHFLGWRQRWIVAGTATASVAAGLFVWGVHETYPTLPDWIPYGIATTLGAIFMLASLMPLAWMPGLNRKKTFDASAKIHGIAWRSLLRPFRDFLFLRLLLFGCWFSFFNGITQSAQNYFPIRVLGLSLLMSLSLQTAMNLGQWIASPWLGRLADRIGNRPVMIVCQLLVAAGLLCYAAATPEHWAWFIGAWIFWIAYAGLNVCLPNLMLKLSPSDENGPYIAAFDAVRGLCYAASTILGGAMLDYGRGWTFSFGQFEISFFCGLFLLGWALRSLGAAVLLLVIEPRAQKNTVSAKGGKPTRR